MVREQKKKQIVDKHNNNKIIGRNTNPDEMV